jgi:hypothetical protein
LKAFHAYFFDILWQHLRGRWSENYDVYAGKYQIARGFAVASFECEDPSDPKLVGSPRGIVMLRQGFESGKKEAVRPPGAETEAGIMTEALERLKVEKGVEVGEGGIVALEARATIYVDLGAIRTWSRANILDVRKDCFRFAYFLRVDRTAPWSINAGVVVTGKTEFKPGQQGTPLKDDQTWHLTIDLAKGEMPSATQVSREFEICCCCGPDCKDISFKVNTLEPSRPNIQPVHGYEWVLNADPGLGCCGKKH